MRLNCSSFNKQNAFFSVILFIFCWLTFANSFHNPFMMDDHDLIVENKAIKDAGFLQLGQGSMDHKGMAVYLRPVFHLFIAIPFLLFGLDPYLFHLFNFFLIFLCAVTFFELFKVLFNDSELALLLAILFITHPINGVLVNYNTTSGFSVMLICANISLILLLQWLENGKRYFLYGLSLILFALSLLCHEIALFFIFHFILAVWMGREIRLKKIAAAFAPYFLTACIYFIIRLKYVGSQTGVFEHIHDFHFSFSSFLAAYSQIIVYYLKNLVFLKDIVLIWAVPMPVSNIALWQVVFFLFWGVCMVLLIIWKKGKQSLGLAWFILGILLLSLASFSRPNLGFIMEPHWLFYPTIGFLLVITSLLLTIKRKINRHLGNLLIVLIVFAYVFSSRQYNQIWNTEIQYCRYMLSLSPGMKLPEFWLADAYYREGEYEQSKLWFKQSLIKAHSDWEIYINLGVIAFEEGKNDIAAGFFLEAVDINPWAAEGYTNLGAILMNEGKMERAEKFFKQAIALDYYALMAKKNLSNLYIQQGKSKEAREILEDVVKIDPLDAGACKQLKALNPNFALDRRYRR